MNLRFLKTRPLAAFVVLSCLLHVVGLCAFSRQGDIDFARPVMPVEWVSLAAPETGSAVRGRPAVQPREKVVTRFVEPAVPVKTAGKAAVSGASGDVAPTEVPRNNQPQLSEEAVAVAPDTPEMKDSRPVGESVPLSSTKPRTLEIMPPLRGAHEFLATTREKLTYRITLLGMGVGEAVIEAVQDRGEVKITTRVRSNSVLSVVYPVDSLVETRLIAGNYIITRVKQREGTFTSDTGFTLKLREKSVFWADRLHNRFDAQPLPREDVTDIVSGFYNLRRKNLEVGQSVLLHLYDSNEYAPTTVEVLRRETVILPGDRKVNALVVHPMLKTEGFFRRNGDILVWLTDDEYKVPVKMETTIALGRVTAELVSAESEKEKEPDRAR